MKKPTKKLVEKIAKDDHRKGKVVQLFAIAMLDYRGPVGDLAWDKINLLVGGDATTAIAFLSGMMFASCKEIPKADRWRELVPELKES